MKSLFKKFEDYITNNGIAKTAVILGYRDTSIIKNWLHKKEIPEKHVKNVQSLFGAKITITKEI